MVSPTLAVPAREKAFRWAAAEKADRRLKRRIEAIWMLLFLNVLTFTPGMSFLPIPAAVGKSVTQASLQVALLLAILANRKLLFRPNSYLFLITLLVLGAIFPIIGKPSLTSAAYTFRFVEFAAVLWLLTPYWGRRDLLLIRCHIKAMVIVLCTVVIGLIVAPGRALREDRLGDALWSAPATQVAHYAAVTIGLTVILWFSGVRAGRITLFTVIPALAILLLTHTRTALLGLVFGLISAGFSVLLVNDRVRRTFLASGIVAAVTATVASGPIATWLERGQNTAQLGNLTGRTNFWGPLLAFPRTKFQEIFGFGVSNGSFNNLPIDSNWILSYQDQGLYGDVVCGLILIVLLVKALMESKRLERAMAIFLVVYCLVASFTEDGFTGASSYTLDLAVAASLLMPTIARKEIITPRLSRPTFVANSCRSAHIELAQLISRLGVLHLKSRELKRRRRHKLLIVAITLLVFFLAATARIIVWPAQGMPVHVDAIAMLAGPGARLTVAEQLAKEHVAPILIVSRGHLGYSGPCPAPISQTRIICFDPNPADTRGEAEYIASLARRYGWHSIVLVTAREQDTRARLLMGRCYSGSVYVATAAQPWTSWPYQIAYGWGSLLKALVAQRAC